MTEIARGEINISVNDNAAKAELKAFEASVKRTFASLERERASLNVDLDHEDFDRAAASVKAQMQSLKRQRAQAIIKMDVQGAAQATAELAILEKKLEYIDGRRYTALLDVNVDQEGNRKAAALQKTLNDITRKPHVYRLKGALDLGDLRRLEQEIDKEINAAQRRKTLAIRMGDTAGITKAAGELRILAHELDVVQKKANALDTRKPIELGAEVSKSDLDHVHREVVAEIQRLEREQVNLRIRGDTEGLEKSRQAVQHLSRDLDIIQRRRINFNPFVQFATGLKNLRSSDRDLFSFGNTLQFLHGNLGNINKRFQEFGGSILNAGIRIGPLTLRLKAAIAASVTLAPALLSLVGGFTALASTLYTGFLGALGPTVAGLGALTVGIGGIAGVVGPLIGDLGKASKATKAYNDAVDKNGRSSDQAKNKLKQLQNVMGSVGPGAAKAFAGIDKLGGTWRRLTASAKPTFFNVIADGVRTARSLMPLFARESTRAFETASRGVQDWMKGLRGGEARNIFRSLFRGFDAAIGPLQRAVGNVVTLMGRVARAGQPLFEEFSNTLERWTQGWANAAKDPEKMRGVLRSLADDTVNLGKGFGAFGRLIHNVFMGGRGESQSFLKSITATLNRWADFFATARGQKELSNFLKDSVHLLKDMASIIASVVKGFFEFGRAVTPIVKLAADVAKVTFGFVSLGAAMKSAFAVFAIFKLLTTVTKLAVALNAAKAAAVAFFAAMKAGAGISAALSAGAIARSAAAGTVASGAAGAAGAAAAGAAGQTAAQKFAARQAAASAAAGGAASTAATKVGLLSRALTVLGGSFAGATLGTAGIVAGLALVVTKFDKTRTAADNTGNAMNKAMNSGDFSAYRELSSALQGGKAAFENMNKVVDLARGTAKATAGSYAGLKQAALDVEQAEINRATAAQEVRRLDREGQRGTLAYRQAVLNLKNANAQLSQAEQARVKIGQQNVRNQTAITQTLKNQFEAFKRANDEARKNGEKPQFVKQQAEAWRDYQAAVDRGVQATVNLQRVQGGLQAVTGKTGQAMGNLVKQFGRLPKGGAVQKFFVQANTKQAEAAIRNVGKLQKGGVSQKQIIDVFANADSAKDALRDLRQLANNLPDAKIKITADDQASPKARKAKSAASDIERTYRALLSARDSASGPSRKAYNSALRLVRAFAANLQAKDNASGVIRGVISLLNSISGRNATSTITTVRRDIQINEIRRQGATPKNRGGQPTGAVGGTSWRYPVAAKGSRVDKATFLAGEEPGHPEFVIATAPKHRARNRKLLHAAARALGVTKLRPDSDAAMAISDDDAYMPWREYAAGGATASAKKDSKTGPSRATKKRRRIQKKATKKKQRQVRKLRRSWHKALAGHQSAITSQERAIEGAVKKRDADEVSFNIDLDNNPIVKEGADGNEYVDEGAKNTRIENLKNLKTQTEAIVTKYRTLLTRYQKAVKKANEVMESMKKRLAGISSKAYGTAGAKKIRKQLQGEINDVMGDRKSMTDRIFEIGDDSNFGSIRDHVLEAKGYERDIAQARATTATSAGAGAGGDTSNADAGTEQRANQSDFFRRSAETAAATLKAFAGGEFGETPRTAYAGAAGAAASSAPVSARGGGGGIQASAAASQPVSGALSGSSGPSEGGDAGGGPQIVIQTLHPGDPATLDAIGKAATGGLNLQGSVVSPRASLGL